MRLHGKISRALHRLAGIRLFRFFTRPLDPSAGVLTPPGIRVRLVNEADLLPSCANPTLDLTPARIEAAFARGDLCAGAFKGEALVGYCWFAFAPLPHLDGVWVDFHAEGVWMYKSLVLPAYRGRRIAEALYRFTDAACAARGRRFSISCVETHNRASIAAKRGTYTAAGYAAWQLGRERLRVWRSPAAARLAVRFFLREAQARHVHGACFPGDPSCPTSHSSPASTPATNARSPASTARRPA